MRGQTLPPRLFSPPPLLFSMARELPDLLNLTPPVFCTVHVRTYSVSPSFIPCYFPHPPLSERGSWRKKLSSTASSRLLGWKEGVEKKGGPIQKKPRRKKSFPFPLFHLDCSFLPPPPTFGIFLPIRVYFSRDTSSSPLQGDKRAWQNFFESFLPSPPTSLRRKVRRGHMEKGREGCSGGAFRE